MITRLGLYGGPRSPYGSFAGKESVTDEEVGIDEKELQESASGEEYYNLPKINSKYLLIAGSLLFLLGLFWIIKYSFSFSFPEITPGMGLAIILTIGILTSFHCVGMR